MTDSNSYQTQTGQVAVPNGPNLQSGDPGLYQQSSSSVQSNNSKLLEGSSNLTIVVPSQTAGSSTGTVAPSSVQQPTRSVASYIIIALATVAILVVVWALFRRLFTKKVIDLPIEQETHEEVVPEQLPEEVIPEEPKKPAPKPAKKKSKKSKSRKKRK